MTFVVTLLLDIPSYRPAAWLPILSVDSSRTPPVCVRCRRIASSLQWNKKHEPPVAPGR